MINIMRKIWWAMALFSSIGQTAHTFFFWFSMQSRMVKLSMLLSLSCCASVGMVFYPPTHLFLINEKRQFSHSASSMSPLAHFIPTCFLCYFSFLSLSLILFPPSLRFCFSWQFLAPSPAHLSPACRAQQFSSRLGIWTISSKVLFDSNYNLYSSHFMWWKRAPSLGRLVSNRFSVGSYNAVENLMDDS